MANRAALSKLPAALWFALAIVIIPLLGLIALQIYQAVVRSPRLERDRALVMHTFEVIEAAEGARAAAQNAERAERGYLLTGEAAYLQSYRNQAGVAVHLLEHLGQLTPDSREQQQRLQSLSVALADWIEQRQRTISAYDRGGPSAAQDLVRSRAGRDTLDTVSQTVDRLIATERSLLSEHQFRERADARRVGEVALASSLIGCALLVLGVALTAVVFHDTRRAESERHEEEKELLRRLAQMEAALGQAQKMEALGQLTGGVVHDFNNLLHIMKNAITIVQRRLRNAEAEVVRYLDMVARNVDRAASTTARLLAFSRQQPLAPTCTDINRLVCGMSEMLRHTIGESIALETVPASGLWSVSTDRNQLETAILNLAVNARDAMPDGGKLSIETSNAFLDESYVQMHADAKVGEYVMIAVRDTGSGMAREVAARAFEPFFTTKSVGRGTGLGLSQVYGFVKQSGGHVALESELGRGTTISIYLPRLLEATVEQPRVTASTLSTGSGESILVVEDNEDVRAFTAQVLGELGYRVSVAHDARLALKVVEQLSGVDLLFTDVGLPGGMSGKALADEVQRRWPRVKVLYTTGYARGSAAHYVRLDPDVELVAKPFTQTQLATKVRRLFDGSPINGAASA